MWEKITDVISKVTTIAVQLIGLSVALEIVFGSNVPFLSLGNEGLVGLVVVAILWSLWKKD